MRGDGTLFQYKGSAVWWGKYYIPGNPKPQRFSTGERDKKRAAKVLRVRVAAATTGQAVPETGRRLKYEDLEEGLLADYRMRELDSLADMPRVLKRLRAAFGGWPALNITPASARAYKATRLDEDAKPATINKEVAALNRMRNLAALDGRLPPQPPIPKLPTDNARRGFLDPPDFGALCTALPDYLEPPTRYAYLSAWRKEEVLGLLLTQLEFDPDGGGVIRLDASQSKNDTGRVLVFATGSPLALLVAEQYARRRLGCPYLFHRNGQRIRDFYAAWRTACTSIGQPHLLFHDLRRSAVRNMVRAGISEVICMARSGHKTRSIFDRYNIVSETDLREADQKVGAYLERAEFGQSGRKIVALTEKREAVKC